MNEVELVFYGQKNELESPVLQKIGVVHYRPATEVLKGFFAVEKRYGSEVRKPLTADILGDHSDADWIIYRYLGADEEKAVRENKLNKKIYVILHNYYSFNRLYESLLKENINQYSLVVDRFNAEIKNIHDINSVIKTKNYFNIIKPKIVIEKNSEKNSFDFSLWLMLVALAKILLNPINELNRYSILMKYSQARVLIRFVELFSFIFFLVRWLGIKLFYGIYRGLGISRVVSIKAGFLTRHIALMSAFKLYGAIVDALSFVYRLFRLWVLTPIFYWVGGWVFGRATEAVLYVYGIFKLYIWTPLFFGLGGWLLKKVVVPVFNFIKFSVRHVAIMVTVKVYGVFFDVGVFLYRIFKLYIWTPLFFGLGGWLLKKVGVPVFNFIKFSVRHVAIMVTVKVYGVFFDVGVFLYRIFKLYIWTPLFFGLGGWLLKKVGVPVLNFIKFSVRHVVIMMTVKVYGVFFDVGVFLYRILKLYFFVPVFVDLRGSLYRIFIVPSLNFFKFSVRHVFVMVSAKTYGFVFDVVMWSDRWIRLPVLNFLKFTVRHFFLMIAYKTYGFAVDLVLFFHRIGKLYLMFPVFKIYWFTSFQYKKRIKKFFT